MPDDFFSIRKKTGSPSAPGSRQCLPYGDRHLPSLPVAWWPRGAALSVVLTSLLTGAGTGQLIPELRLTQ